MTEIRKQTEPLKEELRKKLREMKGELSLREFAQSLLMTPETLTLAYFGEPVSAGTRALIEARVSNFEAQGKGGVQP